MTGLKKLQLCLFTLCLTAGVVDSAQAIATDKRVRQHGGWYVEGEGFYARANDSFLTNYPFAEFFSGTSVTTPGVITFTNSTNVLRFDPEHDWGYKIAAGYDYASCTCCNYGFSLEYTHFDNDRSHLIFGGLNGENEPVIQTFNSVFSATFTTVDANYDTRFNSLDLLGHKNFTVCNCVDMQLFAGARYVNLKQSWNDVFSDDPDLVDEIIGAGVAISSSRIHFDNKFDGAGPRFGANAFYQVAPGFGLVTELAGNLIFGSSKSRYSEVFHSVINSEPGFDFNNDFTNDQPRHELTVPSLSGKIGLAYRAVFRNCSSFVIEAGYRGEKYFGISDLTSFTSSLEENSANDKSAQYHDFSFSGPYVNLSYHM